MNKPQQINQQGRVIIFHKHRTSGRTVFLIDINDSILFGDAMDAPCYLLENGEVAEQHDEKHRALLQSIEEEVHLKDRALILESGFQQTIETRQGVMPVLLARLDTMDVPDCSVLSGGQAFVPMTELRKLAPNEMELVRLANEYVVV